MSQSDNPFATRPTLLGRLRTNPQDQQSWNEFVDQYGTMLLKWARRWGLNQQDAEEVAQDVLLQLARQMKDFQYNAQSSFRGWLKTIAYRAWCDFIADQRRRQHRRLPEESLAQLLTDDAATSFLEAMDRLARHEEMEHAMKLARLRVQPRTWQAFEMTALQNLPVEQVATTLQMNVSAVYVAKSRVIHLLRSIVERD